MRRCLLLLAASACGQTIAWKTGPGLVALSERARLQVTEGLVYAEGAEARRFLESTGNPPSGSERVVTGAPDLAWFVVFSVEGYETLGLVRPVDGQPDVAAIRLAIEHGSRAANAERARRGRETLSVLRFSEEPKWNAERSRVEWSLETLESAGRRVRNHFAYILSPDQVIAAELVTSGAAAGATARFQALLDGVTFQPPLVSPPANPAPETAPWAAGAAVALIVVISAILLLKQALR